MQQSDKKVNAATALLITNLAVSAFILFYLFVPVNDRSEVQGTLGFNCVQNGQYVLYIGLNDKDTYEQIIPTETAKEIANNICTKYVEGYTVSDAQGGWVDENGVLTRENTLIYYFAEVQEADLIAIMDETLAVLNQNTILVEKRDITSVFYNGRN